MDNELRPVIGIMVVFMTISLLSTAANISKERPGRTAINGMGDLNNDGWVSQTDIDILSHYMFGYPISEISPLSEAEFLRRADMNGDGFIDAGDITAIKRFISYG